jgi:charged multivesicular body protein 4A/B
MNQFKKFKVALQALKRKKRYETQLHQIDGTLTTLEYQREVLENASSNAEVLKVMSGASKAFKNVNDNLDVDKVHDMMDDIAEQQQLAGEISSAISNPVGFDQDIDEVSNLLIFFFIHLIIIANIADLFNLLSNLFYRTNY